MEIRELNEGDLDSLIKLYEQLDGANGDAKKAFIMKLKKY